MATTTTTSMLAETVWRIRFAVKYGPKATRQREEFYSTYEAAAAQKRQREAFGELRGTVDIDACTVWRR